MRKKGISETLEVTILFLISIAIMSVVLAYFFTNQSSVSYSYLQQARVQAEEAGQIINLVYYQTQDGVSYFYVTNSGDYPVIVTAVYTPNGPAQFYVADPAINPNYQNTCSFSYSSPGCDAAITGSDVFVIAVSTQTTTITIRTQLGNPIAISAG